MYSNVHRSIEIACIPWESLLGAHAVAAAGACTCVYMRVPGGRAAPAAAVVTVGATTDGAAAPMAARVYAFVSGWRCVCMLVPNL